MRPILLTAAAMAAAVLSSCALKPADPLAEIIANNTEARGGAAAIEAIKNVRTRVEITEPKFTVTGDYRAMDGAMRIDIYANGKRVFSEGVDDQGAWQQQGAGAPITPSSAAGRAALLHGIESNLFGLHQMKARGHTLALEDDQTVDGVAYKVVKLTLSDGDVTYLYINPENWLNERRRDNRAIHPDLDPTQKLIENRYFDFRPFCGVLNPASSKQTDIRNGETLQETKVLSQECNLPVEDLQISRDAVVDAVN